VPGAGASRDLHDGDDVSVATVARHDRIDAFQGDRRAREASQPAEEDALPGEPGERVDAAEQEGQRRRA